MCAEREGFVFNQQSKLDSTPPKQHTETKIMHSGGFVIFSVWIVAVVCLQTGLMLTLKQLKAIKSGYQRIERREPEIKQRESLLAARRSLLDEG